MENIQQLFQPQSGWNLLGLIVALGAISAALLRLAIDLTPIRNIFQTWLLRRWIKERALQISDAYEQTRLENERKGLKLASIESDDALTLLISHATGGHARALFGLPTDQLVAQINAASQIALDYPDLNFSLLAVLSQPAERRAPATLWFQRKARAGPDTDNLKDIHILVEEAKKEEQKGKGKKEGQEGQEGERAPSPAYLNARNRVAHRIERNLDGILIRFTSNESIITQLLAIAISVAVVYLLWVLANRPGASILALVLVGLAAGYLAPIFDDVVRAIRKLGRP